MLTFIDDYSRKVWIYVLKQKSEVQTMEVTSGKTDGEKGQTT